MKKSIRAQFRPRFFSSFWAALVFSTSTIYAAIPPLDLRALLKLATEHSPTLEISQYEIQSTNNEVLNQRFKLYPSLSLSADHALSHNTASVLSTDPWSSSASLLLSETFYDNGVTFSRLKQAKLKHDSATAQHELQKQQLALDLTLEYLRFSQLSKQFEVLTAQNGLLSNQSKLTSNRYRHGLTTQKDYLRFQTQMSRSNLELKELTNSLLNSRAEIARILGVPTSNELPVMPESIDPKRAIEFLKRTQETFTLLQTKEMVQPQEKRILDTQVQTADIETDIAGRSKWPELGLTGAVSYGASQYLNSTVPFDQLDAWAWSLTLSLRWTLFDFGIRARTHENAILDWKTTQAQASTRLQTLKADVEKLKNSLTTLLANFALNEDLFALEEKSYRLLESEYQQGRASYLDLITGLRDRSDAELRLSSAYFNLRETLTKLQFHEGTLYDSI